MNTPIDTMFKDVEELFASPANTDEKAWGAIHDFYHLVLTYMEAHQISKADLSKRLGTSRSAITQMFNKTPNITLKKMIEIADAIGIDIHITSPQVTREQARPKRLSTLPMTPQDDLSEPHTKRRAIG